MVSVVIPYLFRWMPLRLTLFLSMSWEWHSPSEHAFSHVACTIKYCRWWNEGYQRPRAYWLTPNRYEVVTPCTISLTFLAYSMQVLSKFPMTFYLHLKPSFIRRSEDHISTQQKVNAHLVMKGGRSGHLSLDYLAVTVIFPKTITTIDTKFSRVWKLGNPVHIIKKFFIPDVW